MSFQLTLQNSFHSLPCGKGVDVGITSVTLMAGIVVRAAPALAVLVLRISLIVVLWEESTLPGFARKSQRHAERC